MSDIYLNTSELSVKTLKDAYGDLVSATFSLKNAYGAATSTSLTSKLSPFPLQNKNMSVFSTTAQEIEYYRQKLDRKMTILCALYSAMEKGMDDLLNLDDSFKGKLVKANNEKACANGLLETISMFSSNLKMTFKSAISLSPDIKTFGKATITAGKNLVSKVKDIYNAHGVFYDVVEYGKCAVKVGIAVIKAAGAIAEATSIAGIPVAAITFASATNDIINAYADAVAIKNDRYELVGEQDFLKDMLKEKGSELGAYWGDEEGGAYLGEGIYYAMSAVSLLNTADKMLKSFGNLNTVFTNQETTSFVWGKAELNGIVDGVESPKWSDIVDDIVGGKFPTDIWGKALGPMVDPSSTAAFIYEAGINGYGFKKKLEKMIEDYSSAISNLFNNN